MPYGERAVGLNDPSANMEEEEEEEEEEEKEEETDISTYTHLMNVYFRSTVMPRYMPMPMSRPEASVAWFRHMP